MNIAAFCNEVDTAERARPVPLLRLVDPDYVTINPEADALLAQQLPFAAVTAIAALRKRIGCHDACHDDRNRNGPPSCATHRILLGFCPQKFVRYLKAIAAHRGAIVAESCTPAQDCRFASQPCRHCSASGRNHIARGKSFAFNEVASFECA
jgi:hypothetical protein